MTYAVHVRLKWKKWLATPLVSGYVYDNGYIDFHENMYKIKRKSIYNRKYHILNHIENLLF